MKWVESLQVALDYMEDHLEEQVTIEGIAEAAMMSPFHFQRVFQALTDMSVKEYIRKRRLTLAAYDLAKTDRKIIDLALQYGYETPESFSKAFRKQHGISPREARTYKGKITSYNRLSIQVNLKGDDPMQYEIVDKSAFQVVGMKHEVSCHDGQNEVEIPKLWDKMNKDGTDDVLAQMNNGNIQGIVGVCVDLHPEKPSFMQYWIGTDYEGKVPEGMEKLTIPASKWAVFEVKGSMPQAIQQAWGKIYSEWFPSSGYQHAGTPDLEVYSDGDIHSPSYHSEIWIPVK